MSSPIVLTGILLVIFCSCLWYGSVSFLATRVIEMSVAGLTCVWLIGMLWRRQVSFIKTGLFVPFVVFAWYIIAQCLPLPAWILAVISAKSLWVARQCIPGLDPASWVTISVYPYAGFLELTKYLSWGGLFFLVVNNVRTKRDVAVLANGIIWFGVAISIFAIIQHFSYSGKVYWFDPDGSAITPVGPFVMKNNFAGYITMIIPLAMGYILTEMPLSRRVVYATGVVLMSIAMFLSLSRGGVLVYGLTACVFIAVCLRRPVVRQKSAFFFLCAVIAVCGLLLFWEGRTIIERLQQLFQQDAFVFWGHGYAWADIVRIIRDYLFLGSGLGTFSAISSMYKTTYDQDLFTYAHNDIFQLCSEVGILGCIIIGWFVWRFLSTVLRVWIARRDSFVVGLGLGCLISILSVITYALLDFNMHIFSHILLCAGIFGLTYRLMFLHSHVPLRESH